MESAQLHDTSYLEVLPQAVGSLGHVTIIESSDSIPLWLQAVYESNEELREYLSSQLVLWDNPRRELQSGRPLAVYEALNGEVAFAFLVQQSGGICRPNAFVMAASSGRAAASTLVGCLQNEPSVFREDSGLLVAYVDDLTFDSGGPMNGVAYEKDIAQEHISWGPELKQSGQLSLIEANWCRTELHGMGNVGVDLLDGALQLSDTEAATLWMAILLIGAPEGLAMETTAPTLIEASSEGTWLVADATAGSSSWPISYKPNQREQDILATWVAAHDVDLNDKAIVRLDRRTKDLICIVETPIFARGDDLVSKGSCIAAYSDDSQNAAALSKAAEFALRLRTTVLRSSR